MFGGNFAPNGWAFCDGALLPISEYEPLFQLIGTTYGGDGQTNFALPNLQGRVPIHQGQSSGTSNYIIGETGGAETVTLNTNQLPNHSHMARAVTGPGDLGTPSGGLWAGSITGQYSSAAPAALMNVRNVNLTGGSQPHENMPPFLTINFIISLFGTFPS